MYSVSVLIPVCNAEKYLGQCIDSVINQSLKDLEIIAVDDGSTDSSPQMLEEYAEAYPFIKVFHQKNVGVVKTRCKLMSLASGEFVAWIDADDFMEPLMLEKMYTKAKTEDADVVICDYDWYPTDIKIKYKWYKEYNGAVNWNFIERNTQQWNKLVKREFLENLNMRMVMEEAGEGAYAFALIQAKKIASIDEKLYHYRVGHTSLSNNMKNVERYKIDMEKTENQLKFAEKLDLGANWLEYFEYRCIYSWIKLMVVAAFNNEKIVYKECIEQLNRHKWMENKFTKLILTRNFGLIKAFAIVRCIPLNFTIAQIITKVFM